VSAGLAFRLLQGVGMKQRAHSTHDTDQTLQRVVGEYLEMPGLSLTVPQARRLWGLDSRTCEGLLEELVGQHFLRRTPRGLYVRPTHA
jgi:hypothetical protein